MRGFFNSIARVLSWMMDEVAIAAILASLLLIVGPLLAAFCLLRNHHYLAAAFSTSLWILTAIACLRDFRRRTFSWVSVVLGMIWVITTLILLWVLAS